MFLKAACANLLQTHLNKLFDGRTPSFDKNRKGFDLSIRCSETGLDDHIKRDSVASSKKSIYSRPL